MIKKLIGLKKEEAIALIKQNGFRVRITKEDAKSFMGTCDFRKDRINLTIEKGIVVTANIG